MKLWHDDIRPPPDDSWLWARTNEEAKGFLKYAPPRKPGETGVTEISLDHDLGLEHLDPSVLNNQFKAGHSPDGTGYDLVCWMIDQGLVPGKITIHSWNQAGALRMATELSDHGHDVTIQPFRRGNG